MNNQEQLGQSTETPKRTYWKFVAGFLAIVFLISGYALWANYSNQAAKREKEARENYEKATKALNAYEEAMRNDTYGGKTPEETLKMFIEALKKEDTELASKYFILDTKNSREEWEIGLEKAKDERRLEYIIDIISRAVPDKEVTTLKNSAWFIVPSKEKPEELEADINLHFNTYSQVWKIESL